MFVGKSMGKIKVDIQQQILLLLRIRLIISFIICSINNIVIIELMDHTSIGIESRQGQLRYCQGVQGERRERGH